MICQHNQGIRTNGGDPWMVDTGQQQPDDNEERKGKKKCQEMMQYYREKNNGYSKVNFAQQLACALMTS